MKKSVLILFYLIGFHNLSYSQNPDLKRTLHWYFGNGAGINFTGQNVVIDTTSNIYAVEGCATISDTCGNLLFYSNGDTIWNSNHNIVLNGTGLMGCYSSTQSVLFVPQPGNDSLIYVFTTDCGEFAGSNGLRYSILDINANFNEGEIILKNILLFSPTTEKLCATKHANGIDYWIAGHEFNSANYYLFLLTETGISLPIVQSLGTGGLMYGDGYMVFNPNGTKIASAFHLGNVYDVDSVDILQFDNSNGTLSNCISISLDTSDEVYGACFSPNGNYLYLSTYNVNTDLKSELWRFDVGDHNFDSIVNSRETIFSDTNYWFYAMQQGPDGKIYISNEGLWGSDSLSVIINPDNNPQFLLNNLSVAPNNPLIGLPNFVSSYLRIDFFFDCFLNTINKVDESLIVNAYPNPAKEILYFELSESNLLNQNNLAFIVDNIGRIYPIHLNSINNYLYSFNISNFSSGNYFIYLVNDKNYYYAKFTKIN